MELVVHDHSQRAIQTLQADLPQATLLTGRSGVGLLTIALHIAAKELAVVVRPLDTKGVYDGINGTISVDMIRELYEATRTKQSTRRIIIVDDADRMSIGAQNAFLKLLEEPNEHTYFMLTSHRPQQLLSTIRSRVQETTILPVTDTQTTDLIQKLAVTDPTKQAQLRFIANGLPAELARLTADETYFSQQVTIVGDARTLLQGAIYDRLLVVNKYQTSRPQSLQLIDSAIKISRHSLSANPQQPLVSQLERLLKLSERLASNHNIRLQLAKFVL